MHAFVGLFDLQGKNFEISDSDLYSTWVTFRCWSGGASWGLIANNTIYNGGAVHWFDEVAQIIYENNTAVGNSILSQGNNIDTYGGGFVHHVYMGASSFSMVWVPTRLKSPLHCYVYDRCCLATPLTVTL